MLKDSGMLVIPSVPSNEGRFIGFPGLISNFCRSLVKNRKSSILASELLKHILRPVKINQFENPSIISTFKIYLKYLCSWIKNKNQEYIWDLTQWKRNKFVLLLPITSSTLVQKSLWFEFGRLWEDFRICHHGIQCKEHEGSLWKEISFKIKVLLWGMGKCKGYDVSLTLNFYNECFN